MHNKNRLFSLISGIFVIITMFFDINFIRLCIEYNLLSSISGSITIASFIINIPLIIFLFMNNRKLTIIPYFFKAIIQLICVIGAFSIYNILAFMVDCTMLFILLSSTILSNKIDKNILKHIWFVPAAIWFLNLIIDYATTENFYFSFSVFVTYLVIFLSYLTIGFWASDIYTSKVRINENEDQTYTSDTYGYCDLLTHILMLLFTFGIWQCVWIYKMTSYLNNTPNEEQRNPTTKLLLCMFVPFYYIYWTYKSAQRIDALAISKGQHSDISTLCLILSIVISIVPPIIMQDKINNIIKSKINITTAPMSTTSSTTISAADEIRKYKDLLDADIITQEEFDAKKKQLLDL